MALTLLQTIKFGLGYFILVLVWTILYNYLTPSFLEIFFLSAGYAGVSLYLVITERPLEIGRYLTVVLIYIVAKLMWPLFVMLIPENMALSKEVAEIFAIFGYLVILVAGMVWASQAYLEKQYVKTFREISRW